MHCIVLLLIWSIFSNYCECRPSETLSTMPIDNLGIEKCIRPVEDTETYWVCRYFPSKVITPVKAALDYCTTMIIIDGPKIRHVCREEEPFYVVGQNRPLGMISDEFGQNDDRSNTIEYNIVSTYWDTFF